MMMRPPCWINMANKKQTTFCRLLAGALKPDGTRKVPEMKISMKPQTITPKFEGTVRQLFFKKIKAAFLSPQFQTDVVKPLKLDDFIDQEVKNLSGGELQRVRSHHPVSNWAHVLLTRR